MMEHIINKIIEIEFKAQEMINEAKRESEHLPEKIDKAISEKKKAYWDRAKNRIEKIKQEESEFAETRIADMKKAHDEKLEKLRKIAEENVAKLVDDVYKYITKPTDFADNS